MKMLLSLALLLMASCQPRAGDGEQRAGLIGHYSGHFEHKGKRLAASITFDTTRGRQVALLTLPANLHLDKPFDEVRYHHPHLVLRMKDADGVVDMRASLSDDGALLSGKLDGALPASLRMVRDEENRQPARTYIAEDTFLTSSDARLRATLFLPKASTPVPGILLLCGTGNHTKEEYNGWADLFARNGIATLIFDKRDVSDAKGRNLRYVNSDIASLHDLLADAEAAYRILKARGEVDSTRIGVMGFSLGAVEAPVIAVRNPALAFLIAVSGNATTDRDFIVYQGLEKYRAKGFDEATCAKAKRLYRMMFDYVRTKKGSGALQSELDKSYGEGWGQLCFPKEVPNEDEMKYLLGWNNLDFDPAVYWRQVSAPSLVVYGEKDRYIPVDSSIAVLNRIFSGKKHLLTLARYPGTDHTIRSIPSKDSFEFPAYPERYPADLVNWVLQRINDGDKR